MSSKVATDSEQRMQRVAVLDVGSGNLHSVRAALRRVAGSGREVSVLSDAQSLGNIGAWDAMVVPGQGAFGDCMRGVRERGFLQPINDFIESGKPFFGICVGMQILFEKSEESPGVEGLNIFAGTVRRLSPSWTDHQLPIRIPHMGWNQVSHSDKPHGWFYFAHSFYCEPNEASLTSGTVNYGHALCAALVKDNIWACQFHPEKSGSDGVRLLQRWFDHATNTMFPCS